LAKKLSNLGHKVIVVTAKLNQDDLDCEHIDGFIVYRLNSRKLPKMKISLNFPWLNSMFSIHNIRVVKKLIGLHGVDVIHVHNHMFDSALIGSLVSFVLKVPFVLTIHTIIKHNNPIFNLILGAFDRGLLKWLVVRRARAVICPDSNVLYYLKESFRRSKGSLIPYGIDPRRKVSQREVQAIRDEYSLGIKKVILSLGHLHALRDRKDLIAAMPEILKQHPDTVLLIVGAVTINDPIDQVSALGLKKDVLFAGAQPHERIPAFLELCELEAHWLNQDEPSRTSMGIASMEAMSYGRAVVAAANPMSFGEGILASGENIVIVAPHDPDGLAAIVSDLLADDVRRTSIADNAATTATKHFNWESVAKQTLDVYHEALRQ
tara:strand:+ start:1233 stop:2363 length:1131 start_codon:yes stop_codon:yes gene_type:complete